MWGRVRTGGAMLAVRRRRRGGVGAVRRCLRRLLLLRPVLVLRRRPGLRKWREQHLQMREVPVRAGDLRGLQEQRAEEVVPRLPRPRLCPGFRMHFSAAGAVTTCLCSRYLAFHFACIDECCLTIYSDPIRQSIDLHFSWPMFKFL
jgi:hypothetical protein